MTTFRLVRKKFKNLDGQGASLVGGRCNPVGIPAVYTSENMSLTVLETLVGLDKREIPQDYVLLTVSFRLPPNTPTILDPRKSLRHYSPEQFRDEFYRVHAIRIPSIVVPWEYNYVLLPQADGFNASIAEEKPFAYDDRLFSGSPQPRSVW